LSDTDDYDLIDIYAEDVDEMDADVTTAVALQLIAGILVTPNLILIFQYGLQNFGYGILSYPFLMPFANLIYMSILVFLVVASIYLAWALWCIKPRARFDAIVMNIVSIIVHIPTLSMVIAFNLILIFYLKTRQMKEIYIESIHEADSLY
jgi:hypothetical protein